MTKKQVTPKAGGPKASKSVTTKLPKPESSKINKPTPALTADSNEVVRPLQPPISFEESIPLTDLDYRITDTVVEFNLLEIHNWCQDKFLNKNQDDIPIWESNFPKYVVPVTHPSEDLIILCQMHYVPDQRAMVNKDREIMFFITTESINEML